MLSLTRTTLALAVGLACATGAHAWGDTAAEGSQHTRSQDQDHTNKASESIGGLALLQQGLATVAPLPSDYMHEVFGDPSHTGKLQRLFDMTDARIGGDVGLYAERRISELALSDDPISTWARKAWQACKTDACRYDRATRETYGYIVQAAGVPQVAMWAEHPQNGWRTITSAGFVPWLTAGIYHGLAASEIADAAIKATPAGTMSHEARRLALFKAFDALPVARLEQMQVRAYKQIQRYRWRMQEGLRGTPYEIFIDDSLYFKADSGGITLARNGQQIISQTVIKGAKVEYSDDRSASSKSGVAKGYIDTAGSRFGGASGSALPKNH